MNSGEFNVRVVSRRDRMYRLAKSMLYDASEAQDAVQEVFAKLWTGRAALAGYENLDAYILISVRNACLDRIRKNKVRRDGQAHAVSVGTGHVDGSEQAEVRDMKAVAERVIAGLPAKQRLVMHLRDVDGYEMYEIAAVAGMDEATVRMNLSRARKTVREILLKFMDHGV